jgi:hypothetical protein
LPHTRVTDAGLKYVGQVPLLRVLNLDGTAVTGKGFDQLFGLTELRMLYVRECPIESGQVGRLDDEISGLAIYD